MSLGTEVKGLRQPPDRHPGPRRRKPSQRVGGAFVKPAKGGAERLRSIGAKTGVRFRVRGPRSFVMKFQPWRPGLGLRSAYARRLLRMLGRLSQSTSAGRYRNHGFTGARNADATGLRARKRMPLRFF